MALAVALRNRQWHGSDGSIQQNGIYGGWDEDLEQLLSYHNTDLEAEEDALALLDMFDE